MFKHPISQLKKFFTFKKPVKESVVLPGKPGLIPKSQEQMVYEERVAKMARKGKHKTHAKLMQTQYKVKRWRNKKGMSGLKSA